jgi:hypothetical protein
LVGITVHEAIRRELDNWAAHRAVSARSAKDFAEGFLRRTWSSEREGIAERANGMELDPTLLPRLENAARIQLDTFFRMVWPQFETYRHEQHEVLSWFDMGRFALVAKVDLAVWDDRERLLVVDWKTGEWAGSYSDRAQLAFYTLWAKVTLGLELDMIVPMIVRIRSGELVYFQPHEADIQFILELIDSDFQTVFEMNEHRDFPPVPDMRKCLGCSFLARCVDGKAVVGTK